MSTIPRFFCVFVYNNIFQLIKDNIKNRQYTIVIDNMVITIPLVCAVFDILMKQGIWLTWGFNQQSHCKTCVFYRAQCMTLCRVPTNSHKDISQRNSVFNSGGAYTYFGACVCVDMFKSAVTDNNSMLSEV